MTSVTMSSLDVVGCGDSGSGVGSDESRLKLNWARCTGTCWNMFCSRTRPPPRFFFRYSTSLAPSDDSKMLSCSKLSMSDRRIGLFSLCLISRNHSLADFTSSGCEFAGAILISSPSWF
uniref:(northern house mosquito) hypothetical protein n=1 Tax=Culex pipiens TaxID=7175 RepID=A0A8D8NJU8_CULPI